MRKKLTVISFCIFSVLFMSSCSANHTKDVYFIHAVSIVPKDDGIYFYAVAQKQSKKQDEKYFVASGYGKNLKEATEKMSDKYSECYFATNEIYILPSYIDKDFFKELVHICENPFLPSSSRVVLSEEDDTKELLESIENEDELKKLLKETSEHNVSFTHFLGCSMSDTKQTELCVIRSDSDGKIEVSHLEILQPSTQN